MWAVSKKIFSARHLKTDGGHFYGERRWWNMKTGVIVYVVGKESLQRANQKPEMEVRLIWRR
jgi:hypothetical protein